MSSTVEIWTLNTIKIKGILKAFLLTATSSPVFATGMYLSGIICIPFLSSFISDSVPILKCLGRLQI